MVLNILITSIDGVGHINACVGLANLLSSYGHKIHLAFKDRNEAMKKYSHTVFSEIITNYCDIIKEENKENGHLNRENLIHVFIENLEKSVLDQNLKQNLAYYFLKHDAEIMNKGLNLMKDKYQFDIVIIDTLFAVPALELLNIPWVYLHSLSPNSLYECFTDLTPPLFSGFPSNEPTDYWKEYRRVYYESMKADIDKVNKWLASYNLEPLNGLIYNKLSPFLNIYQYPKSLDYDHIYKLPSTCIRIDNIVREDDGTPLNIPEEFLSRPGKLIYFTMGSWLCNSVKMMQRLINLLSTSKHKFIVSMGPKKSDLKLGENMWGDRFLNQLRVLSIVDAAVIHGGQNTFCECIKAKVPFIVIPLFADQYDNAQRIVECGFGKRLNPITVKEEELHSSIEFILNDTNIRKNLERESEAIKNSDTGYKLSERLEEIVKDYKEKNLIK